MVTNLFYKSIDKTSTLLASDRLYIDHTGIAGGQREHPLKQLLLLPQYVLNTFGLKPGQLKENIILKEAFDLHALPSGTTLNIGEVKLRLTFHCEPCSKIKHLVTIKHITHHRGYHAQILSPGYIRLGDTAKITSEKHEFIPYEFADRMKWFLDKQSEPIWVSDLVQAIGLSPSYCRAVPRILNKRSDIDREKILFKNQMKT